MSVVILTPEQRAILARNLAATTSKPAPRRAPKQAERKVKPRPFTAEEYLGHARQYKPRHYRAVTVVADIKAFEQLAELRVKLPRAPKQPC